MDEPGPDRRAGSSLVRKSRWLLAAALACTVLTACGGGGGGDSPSAAAAPSTPAPGSAGAGSVGAQGTTGSGPASTGSGALTAVAEAKGATTLTWQPPTRNDDGSPVTLTGYRIYWGLAEGHYPNSVTLNNPGLTRHVIEQLPPNTYYFVATALSAGGESEPSNVVAMKVL